MMNSECRMPDERNRFAAGAKFALSPLSVRHSPFVIRHFR
jgi:hypothetical protein